MAAKSCADCDFRHKYDEAPRSILGRLWRWHTNWCPGWKAYMRELPTDERRRIADLYGMERYLAR